MNADALAFLAAKGLSIEEIIEFARLSERKADPTNADRQARYRANRKAARDEEVTRYSNSVTPPNDIYSNPPDRTNPEETIVSSPPKPKKPRSTKDGDPLPDEWEPVLTPAAAGLVAQWPPGWMEARLAEFRDHARDKGRRSKDWQAAFRKWLSNADEWTRQRNGRGSQNGSGGIDQRGAIARVLDRDIASHYGSADGQRTGEDGGHGGGPVARIAAV